MDCEIGIQWPKFKCYAWDAVVLLLRHKLVFGEEGYFHIIVLERLDHYSCIFNQAFSDTEISSENTNCSHFKLELMVWYSRVPQKCKVVSCCYWVVKDNLAIIKGLTWSYA